MDATGQSVQKKKRTKEGPTNNSTMAVEKKRL